MLGLAVAQSCAGEVSLACAGFDLIQSCAPSEIDPYSALIAVQSYLMNAQPSRALNMLDVMPPIPPDFSPLVFPYFGAQAALDLGRVALAAELLPEDLLSGLPSSYLLDSARTLRLTIAKSVAELPSASATLPLRCANCDAPRRPGRASCAYCHASFAS